MHSVLKLMFLEPTLKLGNTEQGIDSVATSHLLSKCVCANFAISIPSDTHLQPKAGIDR